MNTEQDISTLSDWLITEARFVTDGVTLVEQLGNRLTDLGVPVWRLRVAQRFANPLLSAWGVIWRPNQPVNEYVISQAQMTTDTWIGSPFQYVTERRKSLRKNLQDLKTGIEHHVYYELAGEGGTDFFCLPLEYSDGSAQGMSVVTDSNEGFSERDIAIMTSLRNPLALVMEPLAVRRSLSSLLKTYLGSGPASSVVSGAIHQGDVTRMNAVIMAVDMRDFSKKSKEWPEEKLLNCLGGYFEIIVGSVHDNQGDILKFIGDGVLAVFPITDALTHEQQAQNALHAASSARSRLAKWNENNPDMTLDFGMGLHIGEVTYGNVGSSARLDFTVIGDAVNLASRIEGYTKKLQKPVLCSAEFANSSKSTATSLGKFPIRGADRKVELFAPE
ncbi:MAG: adenylate/guanylate cyclase domain-containing protein [Rhizobiaceae bacterium]|nr:adenylate/guanylate cyclase domain-containing protein [Rhizobiaceae bacterium]